MLENRRYVSDALATDRSSRRLSEHGATRPRALACAEAAAIVACALLLVVLAGRLGRALVEPRALALVLAGIPLGWLAADLLSGIVHWFCDRFFEETSPVIGRVLIAPFREHHRDPLAMTRHGFLELTGNSCFGLLPVLLAVAAGRGGIVADAAIVAGAVAVGATNFFHKWAHAGDVPPAVAWLQARRLILPPAHHADHHREDHAGRYCVTAGWLNGLVDGLGVFRRLERWLTGVGLPATSAP